jgi:Ca2+-transporting ATPase
MVFNARSPEFSAFIGLFSISWLLGAVLLSLFLQAVAICVPFLQHAFATAALSARYWMISAGVVRSILWLGELSEVISHIVKRW